MLNVQMNELGTPKYVKIYIGDIDRSNIGVNLLILYRYIGRYSNYGRNEIGNAYKAIQNKANKTYNGRRAKFSKREVASLVRIFSKYGSGKKTEYVKIPYRLEYLFVAIFELVDEISLKYDIPMDLEEFRETLRRTVFYDEQYHLFDMKYHDDITFRNSKNECLHDMMEAPNCSLMQNF